MNLLSDLFEYGKMGKQGDGPSDASLLHGTWEPVMAVTRFKNFFLSVKPIFEKDWC